MAYDLSDLTSSVQDDLKDSSFSATRIRRYLNAGQDVIFNTHELKFGETSVSIALVIGEFAFDQQSDHESTIGGVLIDPDDSNRYVSLNQDNYLPHREFFDRYPDPSIYDNNMPSYWTEFGDQTYFNCPADKLYTFKQRYRRMATEMSADDDVPDVPRTCRELLELYADYRGEKYRGNHDVAATYLQQFEDGLESMTLRYSSVTSVGPVIARNTRKRV